MNRAFAEPSPLPRDPLPGGEISSRLRNTFPKEAGPLVMYRTGESKTDPAESANQVSDAEYWSLSLPWRLFAHGPLLELPRLELSHEDLLAAERRLLKAYADTYRYVPLPASILHLISDVRRRAPWEALVLWLDIAMKHAINSQSIDFALAKRKHFRTNALIRGESGEWSPESLAVAELMSDVFVLCWAAKADVDRARTRSAEHGGSVALALAEIDAQQATTFEAVLGHMARPAIDIDDLEDHERDRIAAFAASREPCWRTGIITDKGAAKGKDVDHDSVRVAEPITSAGKKPEVATTAAEIVAEPAAVIYRRIKNALEQKIIARPNQCRQLALIGTAAALGVRNQRVLLVGNSGSGKTHAAKSLAESLTELFDKPKAFMEVNATDLTPTGWRGAELNDLLEDLAHQAGGNLDGAVLVLNEIDKAACLDPAVEGNSREAKLNLQSALLGLGEGSHISPDSRDGKQLETDGLLVIGTGAFGGRFVDKPPTTADLVEWGWMPEFAARWGSRICLAPMRRNEAMELLRRGQNSVEGRLGPLIRSLGVEVRVSDALLGYVAERWLKTGTDFRTASEWVVAAARQRLIQALETGSTGVIVLAPDDIEVP